MKTQWIAVLIAGTCLAVHAQQNNNILLIIGDDIGLDSLHISNTSTEASYPPIPAIQNLAENGVLFSNGYAYPTCSPTRSSILTGRFGYRTGVLSPQSSDNFSADEHTLPEAFAGQNLDYQLGSFGKWHLGGGDTGPNVLGGWPHFAGSLGGGLSNYRRWTKVVNGVSTNLTAAYATRENVTDAISWINAQGSDSWFAWIGFNAAHTPLHEPPSNLHSYDFTGLDSTNFPRPYFEAMIEAMDNQIGRLIATIDTNTTTIIFVGDNGTSSGVIQPPYDISQRAKGSVYEGGTHVPFLIYGADVVNGGRTSDAVVHVADLYATILELAGGTVPASAADSRSLVPILDDQTFAPAEDCILVESDSLPGAGNDGRAIRNAQYKLIQVNDVDLGFYDLLRDPLETTNLLSTGMSAPEQVTYDELAAKLNAWTNMPSVVAIPTNGYPIVDTGQLNYYDDQGGYTIGAPGPGDAFAGQDAHYAGRQPQYIDNDDGTVTDAITGLMWQQTPDLTHKTTFVDAFVEAASLDLGGHADWRVPTVKELYSLIDFTGETGQSEANAVPYIDTAYFDFVYGDTNTERYIDAQYWSSTEYVGLTMNGDQTVFGANFADGRIKGYPKYQPGSGETTGSTMFVRYVRGNTEYGINDFVDNSNGTVTDRATGLMWQKGDSGTTNNWEQALAYSEGLELADYRDWRLPNAKELQSIVDYTRAPTVTGTAAIDTNYFDVTETESFYWSSTTHLDGAPESVGNYAVYLAFGRALGWMNHVLTDVHGAGAQRSDPKSGTPVLDDPGHGPQGDILPIYNQVRCVRGGATAPTTDTDDDGLTDWYEYNYTSNTTAMVAADDDDDDGISNEDENAAGTIPTAADSYFRIFGINGSNTATSISWASELDRSYTLQSTTDLVSNTFSVVESDIATTAPTNTSALDGVDDMVFFRVIVE